MRTKGFGFLTLKNGTLRYNKNHKNASKNFKHGITIYICKEILTDFRIAIYVCQWPSKLSTYTSYMPIFQIFALKCLLYI